MLNQLDDRAIGARYNATVDLNRAFLNDVKAAEKTGESIDEVASTWKIPAKYAGYAAPDPNLLKNNVQLAYAELP